MTTFVIGYDICNPLRLARIHKAMTNFATPIEYSVFVFDGSVEQLEKHIQVPLAFFNPKKDDMRCYQLPQRGLQKRIGAPSLPEGIEWTGLPSRW